MNIEVLTQVSRKAGNREGLPAGQAKPGTDHRETADGYRGVVISLAGYRVANCRDGIQWLFQRRRPPNASAGREWDTLGYCQTRKALIRLQRSHLGAEHTALHDLPKRFKPEGRQ